MGAIFCNTTSGEFYWKDEYSNVPANSIEIDEDAKDFYIQNKDNFAIYLNRVKDDKITIDTIHELVDINDLMVYKIELMNKACEESIYEGFDLTLNDEEMHFSYTVHDQLNIQEALQDSGGFNKGGKHWLNGDVQKIAKAGKDHKNYHRSYCHQIKEYIRQGTVQEILDISYGDIIPE